MAVLALRGSAHSSKPVGAFVTEVLDVATAFEQALQRVPAPVVFERDVVAWRAFAERLRGRLELGRMHVHDAMVGTDRLSIGNEWTRNGLDAHPRGKLSDPAEAMPTVKLAVALRRALAGLQGAGPFR